MKNLLKCVIFFFCVNIFYSCSKSPVVFEDRPVFDISKNINAQKLDVDSSVICVFVTDMESVGPYLIVEDFIMQDNALNIYNYQTGELLSRLAFVGQGPGEIIEPTMNIFVNQHSIQMYEPNLKKLIVYDINNEKTILEYPIHRSKINGYIKEVIKVNDHFICMGENGDFDRNRFVILDTMLNIKYSMGEYPVLIENQLTKTVQDILYYVSHLALKPDNTKIVHASYIGAVLEIFDISDIGKQIKNIKTLKIYPPVYDTKKDVTWGDETIIGFEDLYATDNYIYALLNGSLGAEYKYPNNICVFDWEGNLVMKYVTDVPLRSIAVNESMGLIFATTHYPADEPEFVCFDIK